MIDYHVKGERRLGRRRIGVNHYGEASGVEFEKRKTPRRRGKRFTENKPGHHVSGHRRNRFKSSKQRKHATKIKLGAQ